MSAMTIEQANLHVERYIQQTLLALPKETALQPHGEHAAMDCADPTDDGPAGRKFASRSYQLVGLDPRKVPGYYSGVQQGWRDLGFRVLRDDPRQGRQYLWVENPTDGFRMAFQANELGEIYLIVSSPCVWPHGSPNIGATRDSNPVHSKDWDPTGPTMHELGRTIAGQEP